eukprot:6861985-Pyramimonas_sp.AAC.1
MFEASRLHPNALASLSPSSAASDSQACSSAWVCLRARHRGGAPRQTLTPNSLDPDTVELTVVIKTLSSHLVTREFNSPVNSLRTSYARVAPNPDTTVAAVFSTRVSLQPALQGLLNGWLNQPKSSELLSVCSRAAPLVALCRPPVVRRCASCYPLQSGATEEEYLDGPKGGGVHRGGVGWIAGLPPAHGRGAPAGSCCPLAPAPGICSLVS